MLEPVHNFLMPHLASLPIFFNTKGCLAAMLALVYLTKTVQVILSYGLKKKYDNVNADFRYGDKDTSFRSQMIQRAHNAHLNQWEAFSGFATALLLALQVKGDSQELRILANAFLYVRTLYVPVYVLAHNEPLSVVRSSVWFIGLAIVFRIFAIAVPNIYA